MRAHHLVDAVCVLSVHCLPHAERNRNTKQRESGPPTVRRHHSGSMARPQTSCVTWRERSCVVMVCVCVGGGGQLQASGSRWHGRLTRNGESFIWKREGPCKLVHEGIAYRAYSFSVRYRQKCVCFE